MKTTIAAALFLVSGAAFAQSVNLTAAPVTAALPDGQAVPMWGYGCGAATGATCVPAKAGGGWSPVVITVAPGPLTINLTNNLPTPPGAASGIPTSLVIVGQLGGGLGAAPSRTPSPVHAPQGTTWPAAGIADSTACAPGGNPGAAATFCPPAQKDRVQSFATEVAKGATTALTWSNLKPGTYLIHSGTHPSIQATMGLHGVLVVRTPGDPTIAKPAQAYTGVAYDADVALVLSEIDPVQNAAVAKAVATSGFSATKVWSGQPGGCGDPTPGNANYQTCYPPAVNYDPRYYLINGTAFDTANPASSLFTATGLAPASKVLVRFLNAGSRTHVPSIVGAQTGSPAATGVSLIAEDGNVLPGLPRVQSQVFLPAGKTHDVMLNAPAGATALPLFDRQLSLSTNNQRDGGMQGYISVNGGGLAAAAVTAKAIADQYFLVTGNTLTVADPASGLMANDIGVYGVKVASGPTGGTLTLNANGTFTYVPSATTISDSFTYCGNGATSGALCATVTLAQCTAASGCLGAAPVAIADSYTSTLATRLQVSPPGVLGNDSDPSGLPLRAVLESSCLAGTGTCLTPSQMTLNSDGSFAVTTPGPGNYKFTYHAVNSQKTPSAAVNVSITVPAPSGLTVNVKDAKTGLAINDYRWLIEEDRTFYVDPKCQVNTGTGPRPLDSRGQPCPPLPVPSLGLNFHTSHMPVVAQGCVGSVSCESGQTLLGTAAVCDLGNGACRTGASQRTAIAASQVALDPSKRYYLSILPGDGVNPIVGGAGGAMQVDPLCNPVLTICAMRPFDIAKDCGAYTSPPTGVWQPGGATALCGHAMGGAQLAAGQTAVNVSLQQTPLPTAKISVFVFQDDNPLNGENDTGGGVDVLAPNEPGLSGFELKILDQAGNMGDSTGQITYDMFNMPVSNSLAGMIDPATGRDACPITKRADGIVGMIPTCPKYEGALPTDTASTPPVLSPLAGHAIITNLYPGLYEIVATPGADRIARGEEWLQTNTLDGTKAIESFIRAGEPHYFQEFGPGGYHVAVGFANPQIINRRKANTAGTGLCDPKPNGGGLTCAATINGLVTNTRMSRTPDQRVYSSGSYDSYGFTQCYVSLGPPDGADFAFAKCNADGSFSFAGIPLGNFRVTVFDQWNALLVDGLSTPVVVGGSAQCTAGPSPVCKYEIPVTQWRTNLYTRTFIDLNNDGVSQPDEPGLSLVPTNIRFRDGSFVGFNNTDLNGYAGFNEVFPFLNWLVVETDHTRYKQTGVHVVYDAGGQVDGAGGGIADLSGVACTAPNVPVGCNPNYGKPNASIALGLANTRESSSAHVPASLRVPGARYCVSADCPASDPGFDPVSGTGSTGRVDPGWAATHAWAGLLGQNSFLEFAMKPFLVGENGGIRGNVHYASTRPFDDPSLLLQLAWAPGVPNVKLNLYQVGKAADGSRTLKLVDTTMSTSFDAWAQGFRRDAAGNIARDASGNAIPNMNCPGQETSSPFYFTLEDSKQWLNPNTAIAERSRFKCYDGWSMLNQLQPAPYDGMYKFPSAVAKTTPTAQLPTGDTFLQLDPKNYKTNCTICTANPDDGTPMLPAGKYVVEVIVPPGYELVKEEDKNILLGDVYVAPVTQQFAGFGNIYILPDQAAMNAFYNPKNPLNSTTNLGARPRHEGDTGLNEAFWPCVGATRVVPDYNSLFPGAKQAAPFAGASRPLCDRKEVILEDQASVLAKFYVFTSTHVAGHYTGIITNDFASEFDPFSPQFGEKFAVPNLPVSFKDFAGNEMSRVYSDQWGAFNGMTYSSWGVNPPNPTGYVPQVMIACMNDPGPIPDPANPGKMITDPMYNAAYAHFCYEWPFMPGQTGYMDTPVIPTMAFAAGYNLPDCEYPDTTPAIASVIGNDTVNAVPGSSGKGPWVSGSGAGHTLTITALGDKQVLNHAYSGPQASTNPFNQKLVTRHYGFGSTPGTAALVGSDGVSYPLAGVTWSDMTITGTVPNVPSSASACTLPQRGVSATNYRCAQLVITAANGKQSIDTVTVTIDGKAPTYVAGPNGTDTAIQTAIDNAAPGDLILVGPGTYNELLLMWKPVRLQGTGAGSVTINANAHPAGKLEPWRRQVNCLFGLALNGQPISASNPYDRSNTYSCPAAMQQRVDRIPMEGVVGWDVTTNGNLAQLLQEPTLMGAYEGAGITVLGKGVIFPPGSNVFGAGAEAAFPAGTVLLTNSAANCTDYPANFLCNPSRIDGISITDSSQGGGGIFVHGWNHSLEISNNRIFANHGTLSGGIVVGNGEFPNPYIAGDSIHWPYPVPVPAGTLNGEQLGYGFNKYVRVHHNSITSNASMGDALFSATPSAAGGVTFCSGSDNYKFNYNWVCGNLSTGDGAGVAHAGFSNDGEISHNWIVFNQSTNPTLPTHGGGIGVLGAAPDGTLPNGLECGSVTDLDCPPGLSEGTGRNLLIDANLIMGNSAEAGSGGGVRLQKVNGSEVSAFPNDPSRWYQVSVTNNIIANNVAGWDGGGVSLQDALKVRFINNTVIANDTTASAGVLFNTLSAPNAAVPPPGCRPQPDPALPQDPSCINPVKESTYQPAGLVTMQNTPNLTASLPLTVLCPIGHSSGAGATSQVANGDCTKVSYPLLQNNVFWQNRAFKIEVGTLGAGQQNQQAVVTLVPTLNQTLTGACPATGTAVPNVPASGGPVNYWDIGVRGDMAANTHASGFTLNPSNSILTSFSDSYTGNGNLAPASPGVVQQYCNGARLPPENGGKGYNAPPGRSESTGLYPVFMINQITPAATVDEGHNWINLSYGPLALSNSASYSGKGVALTPLGDYSITSSSPAVDKASAVNAPSLDFFGTPRPQGSGFDIGAVEFPLPTVAPSPLAFGNVVVNTSSTLALTLRNPGHGTLSGIGFMVTGSGFSSTGSNCGPTLAAGASCTIPVTFSPTATGAYSGQVTVTAAGVPVTGSPVSLTGTGVAPIGSVTPTSLTFADTVVTSTSAAQAVTLSNTGTASLTGINPGFTGPFSRATGAAGGTCGTALAAGSTCTIGVVFNPNAAGPLSGTLTVNAAFPVTGSPVMLSGNGIAQTFTASVSPATLAFGNVTTNTTSPAMTATVTNTGNSALSGLAYGTAAPFSRPTGAAGGNCGTTLAVGASCQVNVVFTPTAVTSYSGSLTVAGPGATVTGTPVNLTGAGVAPVLSVSITPNPLNISLPNPSTSGTGVVTLRNTSSTASVTVTAVAVAGGGPLSGYTFSKATAAGADTCTNATLAANATCTVTVNFTVAVSAARNQVRSGTIRFTDNASGSPQTGTLSGVAAP
jgi:hypothetical protein